VLLLVLGIKSNEHEYDDENEEEGSPPQLPETSSRRQ
jgi:hypothetical protein